MLNGLELRGVSTSLPPQRGTATSTAPAGEESSEFTPSNQLGQQRPPGATLCPGQSQSSPGHCPTIDPLHPSAPHLPRAARTHLFTLKVNIQLHGGTSVQGHQPPARNRAPLPWCQALSQPCCSHRDGFGFFSFSGLRALAVPVTCHPLQWLQGQRDTQLTRGQCQQMVARARPCPCQLLGPLALQVGRGDLLQAIKAKSPQELPHPRQGMTKGPESSEREGQAETSHHLLPPCTQEMVQGSPSAQHSSLSGGKTNRKQTVPASSPFWVGGTARSQGRDTGVMTCPESQGRLSHPRHRVTHGPSGQCPALGASSGLCCPSPCTPIPGSSQTCPGANARPGCIAWYQDKQHHTEHKNLLFPWNHRTSAMFPDLNNSVLTAEGAAVLEQALSPAEVQGKHPTEPTTPSS